MFPKTPRALSAIIVLTTSVALGACATPADFDEDNQGEDDGSSEGGTTGAGNSSGTTDPGTGGSGNESSTGGSGTGGSGAGTNTSGGETCDAAADLSSSAASLMGTYTDITNDGGGSCDPSADNIAWFQYTADQTGLYTLNFTNNSPTPAYSRLAVFEGGDCDNLGAEVLCAAMPAQQMSEMALMEAGKTYTIMFYTDGIAYPMVNPQGSVTVSTAGPGALCQLAEDITSVTMPHAMTGNFTEDPAVLGSCDTTPTNTVWFKYTAPTTDTYRILASNQASGAWSRLVVLEGDNCNPLGTEVSCETASSSSQEMDVDLTVGETYIIAYHTDGDTWQMTDPTIDVGVRPPPPPGDSCDEPIDVTSATFPYTEVGLWDNDPSFGGTCDSTADNTAFFTYTPATSGYYQVDATNGSAVTSDTRIVIQEGNSCATLGTQVGCMVGSGLSATEVSWLEAGQDYIIGIYTPSASNPMEDVTIDIQATAAPADGQICEASPDITSAAFPYALVGEFDDDDYAGSTCDSTPNNAVWYRYTAPTTGNYTISGVNASTTFAFSRMAVFETNGCNPFGTEVTCSTASAKTISLSSVALTAGTEYLIVFHTDGETWTMVDPQITITTP